MSVDANGWTIITVSASGSGEGTGYVGAGTRKVFVSQSGNDATGDGSSATPYRTPAKGVTALRDGSPDWLLLRKGDTWTDEVIGLVQKSGASATDPMVFASYDAANPTSEPNPYTGGARPVIECSSASLPNTTPMGSLFGDRSNIAIMGIEFYAYKHDPANPSYSGLEADGGSGIAYAITSINNILIEDCKISFFIENISLSPTNVAGSSNFSLRRNIIIDCYSTGAVSNGISMTAPSGCTVYQNVIDHNGWNETVVGAGHSGFKHNFYFSNMQTDGDQTTLCQPVTITENIIARDSASPQARSGGTVSNNLFPGNPTALLMMQPTAFANSITDNVVTEGIFAAAIGGADAILVGNSLGTVAGSPDYNADYINVGNCAVTGNIVANSSATGGTGIAILNAQTGSTVNNNKLYKWVSADPTRDVMYTVGGVYSLTLTTTGSSYTDHSMAITNSSASADGFNYIVATVAASSNVNRIGQVMYKVGAGAVLGPYHNLVMDGTHIKLYGTVFTTTFAGTLYYPHYKTPLTGGTGTGAEADIVVAGGQVKSIFTSGSDTITTIYSDEPGSGYTVGDVLTSTAIPGGSSFSATVAAICVNSVSTGSYYDATGTNVAGWIDPTRTVARYNTEVRSSTGTLAAFLTAARSQSKISWTTDLTADAVNDWIRAGFSTGATSTAATFGSGTIDTFPDFSPGQTVYWR